MADCAVARCLNERRLIRKHLQRWGKNLLFMVGLERAAQTLGGRKFGEIYPFSGLEPQEPEDWKPDETCYLCDANTSIHPSITDPPLSENQPVEACLDTCISDVLEASTAVDNKHSSDNLEQPLDLSLHRRSRQLDDNANEILEVGPTKPVLKVPQPSAAKSSKRSKVDSSSTWKRTYTEEELELALNDIQSGKLGTRRAAVIYGIPRSTLRNKVYKLANERNNNANNSGVVSSSNGNGGTINNKRKTPTSAESPSSIKSSTNTNSKSGSVLKKSPKTIKDSAPSPTENHLTAHNPASESLKQILKQVITQKANNNNNNTSTTNYNNVGSSGISSSNKQDGDSSPYRTQNIAPSAPLFNSFEDNLAALHMLSTPDAQASVFSQLLLPYVHQFLARLDENHSTLINSCQESLISRNLSFLPDIIRKLTQERVENEKTRAKATSDDNSESTPDDGTNKVILKVPSYKMKSSTSVSNQEDDRNSLNDQGDGSTVSSHYPGDVEFEKCKDESLLKESIRVKQEKLNSKLSNSNSIYSEESSSDALNSENRPSLESCSRSDKRSSTCNSDQSNPSTPDPKRNRPKRGRYRNYDRDDLAKAVNAVQKGEMSVHKAGTIFGVPHSTLEYKVKERHLLRPKKRQSSSHTGGKRNEGKSTVTTVLPKLASSQASSPNHSANNSDATFSGTPFWQAALPFLNVDLSSHNNNFFATNMMRKLYEKRMSEENQHSNRNEFGGLLLENLIKSSLERNTGISEHEASSDMEISADHKDEDEEPQKQQSETSKFNASLAALKEVTALDKKE